MIPASSLYSTGTCIIIHGLTSIAHKQIILLLLLLILFITNSMIRSEPHVAYSRHLPTIWWRLGWMDPALHES